MHDEEQGGHGHGGSQVQHGDANLEEYDSFESDEGVAR